MNELLSALRIASFEPLLSAYQQAGVSIRNGLDGGAGLGSTSQAMLRYMDNPSFVFAFEPFPGNHRFFASLNENIVLIPKALAQSNTVMHFHVPSTVTPDSEWGKRGMTGYSSVGYLADKLNDNMPYINVECVTADSVVPADQSVGFIKLDLQGGELNALKGMVRLQRDAYLLWIEYTGQDGLLEYLISQDYLIFDTEYFFLGSPSEDAKRRFEVSRENITLSTNAKAWFGFKRTPWQDYFAQFNQFRSEHHMVQTDLVCINKRYFADFLKALSFIKVA